MGALSSQEHQVGRPAEQDRRAQGAKQGTRRRGREEEGRIQERDGQKVQGRDGETGVVSSALGASRNFFVRCYDVSGGHCCRRSFSANAAQAVLVCWLWI